MIDKLIDGNTSVTILALPRIALFQFVSSRCIFRIRNYLIKCLHVDTEAWLILWVFSFHVEGIGIEFFTSLICTEHCSEHNFEQNRSVQWTLTQNIAAVYSIVFMWLLRSYVTIERFVHVMASATTKVFARQVVSWRRKPFSPHSRLQLHYKPKWLQINRNMQS